jgi:hypothetical protein
MEKLHFALEIIALNPEVSRFNRYMTLPVNCKLGPSDTQQHTPQTSVVWGIPNSYLIRYIINTYLKRHRLGVD